MKVAVLSREHSWVSVGTLEYFASKGYPISLVIVETAVRTKVSRTEAAFAAANAEFVRIMVQERLKPAPPGVNPVRLVWSILPAGVRERIKRLLGRGPDGPVPPPPIEDVARRRGIPTVRVEKHSSEATKAALEAHGIAIALLASSAWLIKEPLLSMTDTKIINVHQGRLPRHRSLNSLGWSLLEGDRLGYSAHFVDAGVDTGPLLLFREVPLRPDDNLLRLRGRIDSMKPQLFYAAVAGLADGSIVATPQEASDGIHHRPMTVAELLQAEDALQERLRGLRGEARGREEASTRPLRAAKRPCGAPPRAVREV
jgi:folate-dependent phosphoribosylglycinamide formyltransferase PurN